jgi:hypothetical protein
MFLPIIQIEFKKTKKNPIDMLKQTYLHNINN